MSVLFVLKNNVRFQKQNTTKTQSGLFNGTMQIINGIKTQGIDAHVTHLSETNNISVQIKKHCASIVVIEALWAEPEKLQALIQRHPGVKFYCHLHSKTPFIALESPAMRYIVEYGKIGCGIIANSWESFGYYKVINKDTIYLPNLYSRPRLEKKFVERDVLDIGCFGAVRPMKNHLSSAIAAIEFARQLGKKLRFHANTTRIEAHGKAVYQNLMHLFMNCGADYELEPVPWIAPDDFPSYIQKMDLCMQLSLTETFNVVTADAIRAGVPVVVSNAIDWVPRAVQVHNNDLEECLSVMNYCYLNPEIVNHCNNKLDEYNKRALTRWKDFIHGREGN